MNQKYNYEYAEQLALIKNIKILTKKYNYKSVTTKLLLECIICNYQWTTNFAHLKRNNRSGGCPKCSGNVKYTHNEVQQFLLNINIKLKSSNYKNNKQLLNYECMICLHQWQATFHNIKNGKTRCPKCSIKRSSKKLYRYTIEDCTNLAKNKGGACLSIEYSGIFAIMEWECDKKHQWSATFGNLIHYNTWCPECSVRLSKSQTLIEQFINKIGFNTLSNSCMLIPPLELDIYIPDKQIAIEYCDLYWHGEKLNGKEARNKHLNKLKLCQEKGIRLITIFEDEWLLKQEQVKGYLTAILGKTENKIHARKCEIKVVENKTAKQFHNDNHIQGSANGKHFGLFINDMLVALSTFAKPGASKNNFKNNKDKMELARYTVKINCSIRGGLGKLLNYFIKNNNSIKELISYSDNRWSAGNIYKTLKFELINNGNPSYFYFKNNSINKVHRYSWTKQRALQTFGGNANIDTEWNIMLRNGWDRIWDCGSSKWVLYI